MTSQGRLLVLGWLAGLAVLAGLAGNALHKRDALWRIVRDSCIPAARSGSTGRCAELSFSTRTVVLKDRVGALQYLLMPIDPVSGVEDASLLAAASPPYWAAAWQARRWMEVSHRGPIPRQALAITVNFAWGRTQDHLHFHVSCVREDLRHVLESIVLAGNGEWAALPGGWRGHAYEVRKLVAESLDGVDVFKQAATGRSNAMGRQGLAVVATRFAEGNGFWLLRTQVDLASLWLASIEGDVQDHDCRVIPKQGAAS